MTIADIRRTRRVPAKRGMRVRYKYEDRLGTITSARGGYLKILLDGDKFPKVFHPTWMLDYLGEDGEVIHATSSE